jgi:hypothetical protein
MAVMASHTRAELASAAAALDRALGRAGLHGGDVQAHAGAGGQDGGVFDLETRLAA